MGIVQRAGDCGDDASHVLDRHPGWVAIGQEPGRIKPVDEVHRDPQLPVLFPPVVHTDDVGMPKCGGEIGFAVEAGSGTRRRLTTREAAISMRHAGPTS